MKRTQLIMALIGIATVLAIYFTPASGQNIVNKCTQGDECAWVSTNCCPQNMGANWECVNEEETRMECPEDIVCPQVISPKPEANCVCNEGTCEAEE